MQPPYVNDYIFGVVRAAQNITEEKFRPFEHRDGSNSSNPVLYTVGIPSSWPRLLWFFAQQGEDNEFFGPFREVVFQEVSQGF